MFELVEPPVVASDRAFEAHPALLQLQTEVPENWTILKPPNDAHVVMWLAANRVSEDEFVPNLLLQSVSVIDIEALGRAEISFIGDLDGVPEITVREGVSTVFEGRIVKVRHFATEVGDLGSLITQNYYLASVRTENPTLIILTASSADRSHPRLPDLRLLCEGIISELIGRIEPSVDARSDAVAGADK